MADLPAEERSLRVQILSTEHWSLLATRSLTWNESFSRATWFVTVVSASVVALALVADSTDFGSAFRFIALLVLPLLIVIGVATFVRLAGLNDEDVQLVIGMNRLRRGYVDLAPDLEPYFVSGHSEDLAGIMRTYGAARTRLPAAQYLSSIALLVGVIIAVLTGALASLIAASLGAGTVVVGIIGVGCTLATLAALSFFIVRQVNRTWGRHRAPTRSVGAG